MYALSPRMLGLLLAGLLVVAGLVVLAQPHAQPGATPSQPVSQTAH